MNKQDTQRHIDRIRKERYKLEAQRKLFVVAGMLDTLGSELWAAEMDVEARLVTEANERIRSAVNVMVNGVELSVEN